MGTCISCGIRYEDYGKDLGGDDDENDRIMARAQRMYELRIALQNIDSLTIKFDRYPKATD
jgi:hypothetical protein